MEHRRLRPPRWTHSWIQLRHLGRQLRQEARRVRAGTVVDLGCGDRPYASLFGSEYIGVDVAATHGRPDVLAFAEAVPLRNSIAQAVISTQQLEHVDDPARVLSEARRLLAPGGRLLLSTHGVWAHHPDPQDLWRWTEEGLVRLVEAAGFRIERVHRQGGTLAAAFILAVYPLGGMAARGPWAMRLIARALLAVGNSIAEPLDTWLERRLPRHYASPSYLVVASAT